MGLIDEIIDAVTFPIIAIFDPIVKPILGIGEVFMFLIKFISWLVKFIIWFVAFIIWAFTDLLNPVHFFKDFYKSIMVIIYSICTTVIHLVIVSAQICLNTVGGWMQGFWGWDMSSLTKKDKNSIYFKSFNRIKGQKTYLTQANTVPFSIILGTVLCPPIGVFMDMGLSGWINIVVCCLLTLLFYIPGLCYALLIIYA